MPLNNERFIGKQSFTKTTSHNFLVKCAYVDLNWVFTEKMKSMQKSLALRELTFFPR